LCGGRGRGQEERERKKKSLGRWNKGVPFNERRKKKKREGRDEKDARFIGEREKRKKRDGDCSGSCYPLPAKIKGREKKKGKVSCRPTVRVNRKVNRGGKGGRGRRREQFIN